MAESHQFPNLDPGGFSRRKLLQTGAAGALALGAGGILAACGGGGSSTGASTAAKAVSAGSKTGKIHNLVLLSNDWNTVMTDGAKRAAEYLGLDYSESNFNEEESEALTQAQQAIAAGNEMVMIQAADGSSIPTLGKLCQEHGVWLSNMEANAPWFSPIESGNHFMWFFCPDDSIGFYETVKVMLEATAKKTGGGGNVLYVTGLTGSPIDSIRSTAAKKALAEVPGMKVLGSLPGEWSAEGGQKATEELVSRYGNPDAIISQNDGQLTGVLAACRSLGLEPGKDVLLCGCDGTTDILEATAAGQVYSTNFASPAYFGIASVVRVFDGLNGFKPGPLERQLTFPGVVTTKDNATGLLDRFVKSSNLPFDPKLMSRTLSKDNWDPMVGFRVLEVDPFWKEAGVPEPAGHQNPAAYTKAIESGEADKVNKEYAAHNKIKLDDASYKGVEA
jgi:simple sugar transport system substrate-binding protein